MAADSSSPVETAWMWPTEHGGVNGVTIDTLDERLLWFDDAAGCACGSSAAVQSYVQFRQRGPALPGIPADVLAALRQSLAALTPE